MICNFIKQNLKRENMKNILLKKNVRAHEFFLPDWN